LHNKYVFNLTQAEPIPWSTKNASQPAHILDRTTLSSLRQLKESLPLSTKSKSATFAYPSFQWDLPFQNGQSFHLWRT
jgi:hypothetical protein